MTGSQTSAYVPARTFLVEGTTPNDLQSAVTLEAWFADWPENDDAFATYGTMNIDRISFSNHRLGADVFFMGTPDESSQRIRVVATREVGDFQLVDLDNLNGAQPIHIVMRLTNDRTTVFINAEKVAEVDVVPLETFRLATSSVGGTFDEIATYPRALSDEEVLEHYTLGRTD